MTQATADPAVAVADLCIRCMLMRGGTSRGLYFLASDLPQRPEQRDALLLRIMGSGHPLQIDGLGGAHPLTSKAAVISPSPDDGADVDYLFLQFGVEQATVSDQQNCGNILAGVGPFAVERGLIEPGNEATTTRIRMLNSGSVVTAAFATPGGMPHYAGTTAIAGVPGTAAPISLLFADTAGSTTGQLLPTGNVCDGLRGTAAPFALGRSSRFVRTRRSACSAPSAPPPRCCFPAPLEPNSPSPVILGSRLTLSIRAGTCWSRSNSTLRVIFRSATKRASCAPPASSSTEPSSPAASLSQTTDWTIAAMPLLHDVAHLGHAELPGHDPVVPHSRHPARGITG